MSLQVENFKDPRAGNL